MFWARVIIERFMVWLANSYDDLNSFFSKEVKHDMPITKLSQSCPSKQGWKYHQLHKLKLFTWKTDFVKTFSVHGPVLDVCTLYLFNLLKTQIMEKTVFSMWLSKFSSWLRICFSGALCQKISLTTEYKLLTHNL